jgi:hypothetical protein
MISDKSLGDKDKGSGNLDQLLLDQPEKPPVEPKSAIMRPSLLGPGDTNSYNKSRQVGVKRLTIIPQRMQESSTSKSNSDDTSSDFKSVDISEEEAIRDIEEAEQEKDQQMKKIKLQVRI